MAEILNHMAKFRYWKLTIEEMEKITHNEDKVLNWDIKCIREPEEEALFFGMGWVKGVEPSNGGITIRCVNHFATPTTTEPVE